MDDGRCCFLRFFPLAVCFLCFLSCGSHAWRRRIAGFVFPRLHKEMGSPRAMLMFWILYETTSVKMVMFIWATWEYYECTSRYHNCSRRWATLAIFGSELALERSNPSGRSHGREPHIPGGQIPIPRPLSDVRNLPGCTPETGGQTSHLVLLLSFADLVSLRGLSEH
jgi:hypothetical protein